MSRSPEDPDESGSRWLPVEKVMVTPGVWTAEALGGHVVVWEDWTKFPREGYRPKLACKPHRCWNSMAVRGQRQRCPSAGHPKHISPGFSVSSPDHRVQLVWLIGMLWSKYTHSSLRWSSVGWIFHLHRPDALGSTHKLPAGKHRALLTPAASHGAPAILLKA